MSIRPIAANQTEVSTSKAIVFFSYRTPVAAKVNGVPYRTEKFWSTTTSRHINKWLDRRTVETRPQAFFDSLLD